MPEPSRPEPPASHVPQVESLSGGVFHRVHAARFEAHRYNQGGQGNARFSPLRLTDGRLVPTIYLAASERTAIAEVLFHEAPTPSTGWIFDWSNARRDDDGPGCQRIRLSSLVVPPLRIIKLTTFALKRMGLEVSDLLDGNADQYPRTRRWAAWLYEQASDAQGLYWMSRRDNEHACLMLFGDRIDRTLQMKATQPIARFEAQVYDALDALGAAVS